MRLGKKEVQDAGRSLSGWGDFYPLPNQASISKTASVWTRPHRRSPELTVLQDTFCLQNSDGIPSARLEAEWPSGVFGKTCLQLFQSQFRYNIWWVSAYLHASTIHQYPAPPHNGPASSCAQSLWSGTRAQRITAQIEKVITGHTPFVSTQDSNRIVQPSL